MNSHLNAYYLLKCYEEIYSKSELLMVLSIDTEMCWSSNYYIQFDVNSVGHKCWLINFGIEHGAWYV